MPTALLRHTSIERIDGYSPVKSEITSNGDDAGGNPSYPCLDTNWDPGNNYLGSCKLNNGNIVNGGNVTSGFMFRDVQIPKNAQIKYAFVTFTTDGTYGVTPNVDGELYAPISLQISGENTASPENYSSTNTPDDRNNLTASISWKIDGSVNGNLYDTWRWQGKRTTPNIGPILSSLINLPGWQYGNPISLIFENASTGNEYVRRVIAKDAMTGNNYQGFWSARLVAAYSLGDETTSPPSVISITRASASPTNAPSVNFAVTFSESVSGVDTGDFSLDTLGVSGAAINTVSGSGNTYTVLVNTGTGDGTIHLNLIDNDSIVDANSEPLNGSFTGGETYTIDKTAPSVMSIVRLSSTPATGNQVLFGVTFSENISGIDTNDFSITTTGGISGAVVNDVYYVNGYYQVLINTGTGNGTLRLDIPANATVTDLASNPLSGGYTGGEVYGIDRPPSVVSVVRASASPTNAPSVNYTVTFSEAVSGVDASDFSLTASGISGASVSGVSGSGAVYTVSANTGSGNGNIRLDVKSGASISDTDYTPDLLPSGFVGGSEATYTIDKTIPSLQSISRASGTPTNASSVSFTLVFSEAVTGLDAGDFSVSAPGLSGWYISAVNVVGPANVYNVTIYTGSGSGSVRLDMINNGTVKDAAGNTLSLSGTYTGPTYVIDKTNPTGQSSVRASLNPTQLTSVPFTVVFSESVTGVDTADFNLTLSGISGAYVSSVSGSGTTYTVYAATGSGSGTLRLNVVNNGTIKDAANNSLGGSYTSGQTYNIRTATFSDVPTSHWAWQFIERVYSAGIMGGCSGGIFCPESNLLRDQMAVVLLRGIHGAGYTPPAVGGSTGFNDVAVGYWAAAWIKQLAAEGITSGCGGGNYCPTSPVTRAQMAVFLLKAKYGASYYPPNRAPTFTDTVGHWAEDWIQQLVVEGIASGCTASAYCPESNVTRAQAAVFLVRTFNLP